MNSTRVKVLFGSGSRELNERASAEFERLLPDLPTVVMSEFEIPEGAHEWIPYHHRRSAAENLELIKAKLGNRQVAFSAVVLDPKSPYGKLRWIGFRLSPARFLAFNENLNHFMLRPVSAGTIVRHFWWRFGNFARYHIKHGGFIFTWYWRLRQPSLMRRPFFYRVSLAAGWLTSLVKAGSPVGSLPAAAPALPDGISVVIPSRSGRSLLAKGLPPALAQLNQEHSEVIIVDNGSDDGTTDWLALEHPPVIVVESERPMSFARAVNAGIARARYSHVCLLNNDMVVDPGFFASLRAAFAKVPDLFCATAQIFLPAGARREETGKTAFPLERPREGFPVTCEVPIEGEDLTWVLYGSGGCSLYDTAKLRALGAVGEVFSPAYVEDLDLGFRAWRLNWPSVYVAAARVLHHHRTTTSRHYSEKGLTVVLERNYLRFLSRAITDRRLFAKLWREAIVRQNLTATHDETYIDVLRKAWQAPGWIEPQPRALLAEREILELGSGGIAVFPGRAPSGRRVVLIASPYVPFPLSHGGAVRMFNLMSRGARDFDQVLICFVDQLNAVPPEVLEICTEVIYIRRAGSHALPSSERPDVVEEFDSPVFRAALHQTIRKWKPGVVQLEFTQMALYAPDCKPARTMLVEHDITLDLYAQLLRQNDDWETRRQYEKWVRFENHAWGQIDRIVTMSEKDRAAVGRAHAVALPNGVDLQRFQASAEEPEPRRILFIGTFQHLPNLLALEFFLREAWPVLQPLGCVLHVIAGSRPEFFLERYKDRVQVDTSAEGIEVEGFVPDVRPAYRRAAVVIAPLLASAGTNIKVMEAMAMGKAIVSTPAGINGLHELEHGRDVLVASTGAEMATAIVDLIGDAERRKALERAARRTAEEKFDWDAIAGAQAAIYRALMPPPG